MVNNLGKKNSLLNNFVAEIRDSEIQRDRMRFRRNLERIGEIFAYEISKTMEYEEQEIQTPLGSAMVPVLIQQPVLATILRAGIPLHNGLLSFFDNADNAFISAYRKHDRGGNFTIQLEYVSCPDLSGRVLIISDPMLATGASLEKTIQRLTSEFQPVHIHIVTAIASAIGVDHVRKMLSNVTIWAAAIDEELTAKSYIVPGLGDAGDLAFGEKLQD